MPTGPTLEKFKRKWYKSYIDPDFDIEAQIPPRNTTPHQPAKSKGLSILGLIYASLYIAFLPAVVFGSGIQVAMAAHVVGLIRDYGLPFTRAWWVASVADENLHSLFFCLLFLWINHVAFWLIPECIMAILALGHLLSVERIVKSEDWLLTGKAKYEIM